MTTVLSMGESEDGDAETVGGLPGKVLSLVSSTVAHSEHVG